MPQTVLPATVGLVRGSTVDTARKLRRARKLASSGRYPSLSALAKAAGLSERTLSRHRVRLPCVAARATSEPTPQTATLTPAGPGDSDTSQQAPERPRQSLRLPDGEALFPVELPQSDGRPPLPAWTNFVAGRSLTRRESRDFDRRMRHIEGKQTRRDRRRARAASLRQ